VIHFLQQDTDLVRRRFQLYVVVVAIARRILGRTAQPPQNAAAPARSSVRQSITTTPSRLLCMLGILQRDQDFRPLARQG